MKEEILKRMDALADKLGTSAQFLFNLYVKQAHVQVIETITYGILFVVLALVSTKIMLKGFHQFNNKDMHWREANKGLRWVITGILTAVVAFIFLLAFMDGDIYTAMMNPQYWAFKEILHDIHEQ